jgi:ABC-type transporter Mla subunit MlaD
MRFDVYHHFLFSDKGEVSARLDSIQATLTGLTQQGSQTMATTQELLDAVTALATAFAPLPAAIDALEAAVAAVTGMSATDQANIDAALAAVQELAAGVTAAVADATDGVNEVAVP